MTNQNSKGHMEISNKDSLVWNQSPHDQRWKKKERAKPSSSSEEGAKKGDTMNNYLSPTCEYVSHIRSHCVTALSPSNKNSFLMVQLNHIIWWCGYISIVIEGDKILPVIDAHIHDIATPQWLQQPDMWWTYVRHLLSNIVQQKHVSFEICLRFIAIAKGNPTDHRMQKKHLCTKWKVRLPHLESKTQHHHFTCLSNVPYIENLIG